MPLFDAELARYDGQCGRVEAEGDGTGVFVYAILPGATYNLLRAYALTPDPETGEDRTLFDAVILRPPPAGPAGPAGAIPWQTLVDSAFLYLDSTELAEPTDDEQQQPRARWLRKFAKQIGQAVREVARGIVHSLGAIDRVVSGTTEIRLELKVLNRDPAFPWMMEMQQAWGRNAGEPAKLEGVQAELKMKRLGGLMPTLFVDKTSSQGVAHISAAKGGDPRGRNPVCVRLDNAAGSITQFLAANRVCDFNGTGDFPDTRRSELTVAMVADDFQIHALNALTDAHRYFEVVAGHPIQPAKVVTGGLASALSGRAMANCMGLTGDLDFTGWALSGIPLFGQSALAYTRADIVLPSGKERRRNSRGLIVHEYGHFSLCSMLWDVDPELVRELIERRITEWGFHRQIDETDELSHLNEAFADFVAGQVVGGTDYVDPEESLESLNLNYCRVPYGYLDGYGGVDPSVIPPLRPCLEGNATGVDASGDMEPARTDEKAGATVGGYGQINRVMTTVHDAFDGHYWKLNELRARDVPGNADYYRLDRSGDLQILRKGWALHAPGATAPDEVIALPGTAIPEWIHDFAHHFETMVSADVGFLSSLARTMQAHGATWCQACDLFLLHQDGAPTALADRWIACAGGPGRLYEYLGRPPDPFLNIDATDCSACPPLHYADGAGVCHACPAGEVPVWGGCEPCPDGSIPGPDGRCDDCDAGSISQGADCVPCGPLGGADRATNSCVPCLDDLVVDWSAARASCQVPVIDRGAAATAPDLCQDLLWVRVEGLDAGGPVVPDLSAPWDLPLGGATLCGAFEASFGVFEDAGTEQWLVRDGGLYDGADCSESCRVEWSPSGPREVCDTYCLEEATWSWPAPASISSPDVVRLLVDPPLLGAAALTLDFGESCSGSVP